MTPEGVTAFVNLFRGRGDCYGSWTGGCVRQPLTRKVFEQHLTTGPYIGVYPLLGDQCSWGCIDVDFKDLTLCRNLKAMAAVKDIKLWIEETVRGYHLWCFPSEALVSAAMMRRALMAICKACKYDPKEVNPKAEVLAKGAVGNYVRLPYPGGWTATERRFLDDASPDTEGFILYLDQWGRTDVHKLADVAALWTPPKKVSIEFDETAGLDAKQLLLESGGPLSWTIWRDGPLEGNDRSGTLSHLAHVLILEDKMDPTAALKVLWSHDERWGRKFVDRPEGERFLQEMIESAVGKRED
jgi:hypothetical protein